ncbi:hypothetical protein [Flavobacterium sp. I-STPA6A]|uniref:hypothetical protein n=2 Tax=Flavobacterium TaxID=237 RepID=UPI00131CCC57|nr:hypothetical protein [Flavobacterium sp. I-STPA6A]
MKTIEKTKRRIMKIRKFEFNIGSYFGPTYSLLYKSGLFLYRAQTGDESSISSINPIFKNDYQFEHIAIFQSDSFDADLVISEERKLNFFKYIIRYCKSWEKEYSNNIVCDGTSWECDIWIDDFRLKSNGLEEYPSNFKSFLNKLSVLTSGKIFE